MMRVREVMGDGALRNDATQRRHPYAQAQQREKLAGAIAECALMLVP